MAIVRRSVIWGSLAVGLGSSCSEEYRSRGADAAAAAGADLSLDAGSSARAGCLAGACDGGSSVVNEGCSGAELLRPDDVTTRRLLEVAGTTRTARDTSQSPFGACAGNTSGADAWYRLDLRDSRVPLDVQAAVDAEFDAVVDLRRGPCGDSRSLACDRASVVGRLSSSVAARLAPDVYWLVVGGADAASRGAFLLHVEVDPGTECVAPAPNRSCARALPLEALARQTILLDEGCTRLADAPEAVLYYQLDLRDEVGPVRTRVSAWGRTEGLLQFVSVHEADEMSGECDALIAASAVGSGAARRSNTELDVMLPPARYVISVDLEKTDRTEHSAVTVQLDRGACAGGPVGNDCGSALDIDPSLASQVVEGSTLCNGSSITLDLCVEPASVAPEQLHRLDLRAAAGATRARFSVLIDGLSVLPVLYVLGADAAGSCGTALSCNNSILNFEGPPRASLLLDPGVYFIGVDGAEQGSAGSYRMLVELAPDRPSPCVNRAIEECMDRNPLAFECCTDWSAACTDMAVWCGLERATQDCVCDAEPACCAPSTPAEVDCDAARTACGYLCPEFAPSERTCLGAPP